MKRINLKPIIITTILIVIQATCYLIAKALEGEANLIGNAFDDNTPFIIYAIIPYCIWYIMLFIVPYILYKRDSVKFSKYCLSYIFVALISSIIFIIYPTTIYRLVIEGY